MRKVATKGEKLYMKTRPTPSSDSIKRAKELIKSTGWVDTHPLLSQSLPRNEDARIDMLKRVGNFRPAETVFEIGHRGNNEPASMMRTRRDKFIIDPLKSLPNDTFAQSGVKLEVDTDESLKAEETKMADEEDIKMTFVTTTTPSIKKRKRNGDFRDAENYMSHYDPSVNAMDHAYDVHSFADAARRETLDLVTDEGRDSKQDRGKKWDAKNKKFVYAANETDGSHGRASKMIKGESGVKIPASYSAGRYAAWKNSSRNRNGDVMPLDGGITGNGADRKFKHHSIQAPKAADKFRDDYHTKLKQNQAAREKGVGVREAKNELKGAHRIRKDRSAKEKRKERQLPKTVRDANGSSRGRGASRGSSRGARGRGRGRGR